MYIHKGMYNLLLIVGQDELIISFCVEINGSNVSDIHSPPAPRAQRKSWDLVRAKQKIFLPKDVFLSLAETNQFHERHVVMPARGAIHFSMITYSIDNDSLSQLIVVSESSCPQPLVGELQSVL
jgi:hypothetical protein